MAKNETNEYQAYVVENFDIEGTVKEIDILKNAANKAWKKFETFVGKNEMNLTDAQQGALYDFTELLDDAVFCLEEAATELETAGEIIEKAVKKLAKLEKAGLAVMKS